MHGRLKVRTTEEERERKKKEQALKVKAYRAAMSKIQEKRRKQELDDELLQLTSQLLLRNPDVSTLWNIRRECVERMVDALAAEDAERKQSIFDTELGLTEQCLQVNPKSYGGWHHRCWTLEHSPHADWDREVQLCNKYLKLDERNFHTWDYRRYVVDKAGVPKAKELDFCTEKIKVNFSNYSSWHYRSLLLPKLYPYEGEALPKRAMSEPKLKEELEMVLTAAFTDPNDSSAWFYQRWLLGYSRQELDICSFRCDTAKAVLAFTNPIALHGAKVLLTNENGETLLELKDWLSLKKTETDTTWLAAMPKNHAVNFSPTTNYKLEAHIPGLETKTIPLKFNVNSFYYFAPPDRPFAFTASVRAELQTQLESCESLLEYEPDSKWTLLTSALLMRAIDRQQYHSKSLEYLEKLQKADQLRRGYYRDLASKWILEKLLTDWAESGDIPKEINLEKEEQLTSICYGQYLIIADKILQSPNLQNSYGNTKIQTFSRLDF